MIRILFLLISSLSFSQHTISGVVEYTVESLSSEITKNIAKTSKNVSEQKALLEIFSNEPAHFILEFNGNEAIYKNAKNEMQSDANKKPKPKFLEIVGGGNGIFYSNSIEKSTLTQKESFGELFLISSKFLDWELTSETKKIGNYTCFKAKYIAKNDNKNLIDEVWYTPEIPVQFGPTKYIGLPGLVLEVIAGKVRFTATKIQLNSQQPIVIEKPNKGTKITEEEYTKKLQQIGTELGF
ncbi:GLPGLI family protein [Flavobacterium macrobrachii]|uniref:GLPGLI family protein n=1 Tax=Flavobacterium macrobrachii TaxID=591204 RepID=A0ABS2CUW0_9FLAO|nr:GLPGLI family protein [Flavobacterium macrobrachii]MBM6498738.1 GLPGLI family protein [Flavobacterium macrobrachii]